MFAFVPVLTSDSTEDIDRTYSVKDLEQTGSPLKWPSKKKNLEAVYKSLTRYIRDNCEDLDTIVQENPPDFNAIAEQNDVEQTEKVPAYMAGKIRYIRS